MTIYISPDVEQLIIDYLKDQFLATEFDDISITAAIPSPRPDYFIVVSRTGGSSRFPVFVDPSLGVDTWGVRKDIASEISRLCDAFIMDIDSYGGSQFYKTDSFAQLGYFPDPETGTPRYRSTYSVHTRKHVY